MKKTPPAKPSPQPEASLTSGEANRLRKKAAWKLFNGWENSLHCCLAPPAWGYTFMKVS
ncbi:hypothetical protein BN439_0477 [Erwinia amylovora Ea644]|nr:hypothetical protein BN439_0477 [Erwinia amylovora Ea644]CCP05559.1 hypothetical protein BN440_0507 [Erwinia amylovora MR1]